jgi:hypothetical protein
MNHRDSPLVLLLGILIEDYEQKQLGARRRSNRRLNSEQPSIRVRLQTAEVHAPRAAAYGQKASPSCSTDGTRSKAAPTPEAIRGSRPRCAAAGKDDKPTQ